jgi:hypothetical protein
MDISQFFDQTIALRLSDMAARHPGLTCAIANSYEEAARVCLGRHHNSPKHFAITSEHRIIPTFVAWDAANERECAAWANDIDATEAGAYACVLAAVEFTERMVAVRRAETFTGADYYVAPTDSPIDDLEDCFRLEISGTNSVSVGDLERLLVRKLEQARAGTSNLPAMAGVIGFRVARILIQRLSL